MATKSAWEPKMSRHMFSFLHVVKMVADLESKGCRVLKVSTLFCEDISYFFKTLQVFKGERLLL